MTTNNTNVSLEVRGTESIVHMNAVELMHVTNGLLLLKEAMNDYLTSSTDDEIEDDLNIPREVQEAEYKEIVALHSTFENMFNQTVVLDGHENVQEWLYSLKESREERV